MLEQGNFILPDWLKRQAQMNPETIAITAEEGSITYRELHHIATTAASVLHRHGIEPGMRVGVLVRSGFLYAQIVHALIHAGAVLVPLNWRLTTDDLVFQMKDSRAKAVLYDSSFFQNAQDVEAQIQGSFTMLNVEQIIQSNDAYVKPLCRDSIHLDDVHSILYTSGTTGLPKGAQITFRNHLFNTLGVGISFGLHPGDKWLVPMPLFHVGGLTVLMRSVIYGVTVVIHSVFDAKRVNQALHTEGISIVSLVPTMLTRLLRMQGERKYPESLRVVFLGGSATPKPLMEQALRLGVPVYQSYGLTEADSTVCILHAKDSLRKIGSSGKPLFPTEIAIFQDENMIQEPNVVGEIMISGPTVISGYLNREKINDNSFMGDWFHTGDIGRIDDEGYLYVLDRRPDLIVSGGENIYPTEVEAVLLAHEKVEEAGVVGAMHPEWGQVPVAFIKLVDNITLTDAELIAFCGERLAKFKIPTQFFYVDSLPRNASGKLLRKSLRECLTR